MKTPPKEAIGEIPIDHPWFQAVLAIVREKKEETYTSLLVPPTHTSDAGRHYDAGRLSMAEDIGRALVVRAGNAAPG